MRTYRVAIVGTGGIAAIHARDLAKLGAQAEIVAAVDVDPARLDAFADTWKVPQRFTSLEGMLRRAAPDVVHLCTPPALHHQQALTCLAAGVTTLCEKPPALSLAELDEIAAAQTATARFATVFQHRFGSGLRRLRRLLAQPDPRLGRPLTAVCNTLWFRPDEYFTVPWRGRWEVEGGGPTLGHGIHQMDLLLAALGPWQEVVAVAGRRARRTATEDVSAALVTFADGTVATVLNSLVAPRQTSYVRVDLEHATVELEHLYGYDDASWTVTAAPGHEQEVAAAWAEGPPNQPSGHAAQFAAVLEALQAGAAPPVGPAEARPTMELVAAVYASAFTGARVRAGEIGPGSPFYTRMDGHGAPWDGRAPAAVR
jgi:predicted dehydrogenase